MIGQVEGDSLRPKEWYVLRVASGRESTVKESLLRKIQLAGLQDQVPTVLVPTERVSEIKGGKKRFRERKLYPGYIIVEMELSVGRRHPPSMMVGCPGRSMFHDRRQA